MRRSLWDKFWRDKHGDVVIFQMPNVLLYLWAGLSLVSMFTPRGKVSDGFWWASMASLAIWSLLEIFKGVNYFRRVLGLVVLGFTVAAAFGLGR
jgi:hypothetical protein